MQVTLLETIGGKLKTFFKDGSMGPFQDNYS